MLKILQKGSRFSVSNLMTPEPLGVSPDAPLNDVSAILSSHDIRHLPVVDANGILLGMISDRDVRSIAGDYLNREAKETATRFPRAEDFCELNPITVFPDDEIIDAVDLMLAHKVGALPVIETKTRKLVGILSYIDILREFRDSLSKESCRWW